MVSRQSIRYFNYLDIILKPPSQVPFYFVIINRSYAFLAIGAVKFSPQDLAPPYWINMGAVAISTLSGTILIANAPNFVLLQDILPFLKGFTLLFWGTGTWWIPMLVVLGIWRYLYKKVPMTYNPLYWGAVFPLGMYTAATFQLAKVTNLSFIASIPQYFIYIALTAWVLTFSGLVIRLLKNCSLHLHQPEAK